MTTIVFPGQGSQYVTMSKDFYDEFPIARETIEFVEETSKIKIRDIIFQNIDGKLDITKYTQLAIFSASISIYNVLINKIKEKKILFNFSLGHSLGEYSALVASKVLDVETCTNLLKYRGEVMQSAYEENKSGMVAIIGLDCNSVEKIICDKKLNLEVANDNSPQQVVISGIKKELLQSEHLFIKSGAKRYVSLNVSAAFHSKFMKEAEIKMKLFLDKTNFKKPIFPIISNYSGKESKDKEIIFQNLINQMSNKVRWVESIKTLEKKQEKLIIEIGPGKVLSGLIKRISDSFTVININSIKELENYLHGLSINK